LKTVEIYDTAGTRQPELLHAGFVEGELCACLSEMPYRIEFVWSRREETSADATERAVLWSNDERICPKERM